MAFSYKSAISFGLVYVPVTLHGTVKKKDIGFNMLHKKSGERIKYKKTCEKCPEVLTSDDIIRGYQYEKGKYITITDKELEDIKTEKDKSIEISAFVDLDEIDPIYFEKSYWVKPTGAEKAFRLIMQAIAKQNKVGIAKTVLGQKEQLVALRAMGDGMVLYTMHFNDEIQSNPTKEIDEKISDNELKLASQIIDSMTTKFEPKNFKDEYRQRLENAIQAKINGEIVKKGKAKALSKAKVIDLMDALKASVDIGKKKTIKKTAVKSGKS